MMDRSVTGFQPDIPGPSGEWPKGTQHNYIDGCTPLVVSRVIAPGNGSGYSSSETSYREEIDEDPLNPNIKWVTQPVPGYAYPGSEEPAISTELYNLADRMAECIKLNTGMEWILVWIFWTEVFKMQMLKHFL